MTSKAASALKAKYFIGQQLVNKQSFVDFNSLIDGQLHPRIRVSHDVWQPTKGEDNFFTAFLHLHSDRLFLKKSVLDMGCGCGVIGIQAHLGGANQVTFSDVSQSAINDAIFNGHAFKIAKANYIVSDLFNSHASGRYDTIIFNHPFFVAEHDPVDLLSRGTLARETLLIDFFANADSFLLRSGVIIMHFWGQESESPIHIANALGWRAQVQLTKNLAIGGWVHQYSIFEIRRVSSIGVS